MAIVVIALLGDIGVGLSDPPPLADDLSERAIDFFEAHEEWYFLYGRWEDLAIAIAFAGLLLAAPFVKDTTGSRHALMAGSTVVVVGEVIDLSQLIGINVASFALENDQMTDFAVGNMYRIGINHTAAFVSVAGLIIAGVGLLLTARDARSGGWWRPVSGLFGISLIVAALADLSSNAQLLEVAEYTAAALALAWILAAYKRATGRIQTSE